MSDFPNISGYEIREKIGSGGMATVYLAIQQNLDRKIALKVMSASLAADPIFCKRFIKEGKIIAQVSSHPDIVTIYDIGYVNSVYYMAMEYIDGGSLTDLLDEHVDVTRAIDIIKHIARALGYAHNHGFVHRDVKPANILFREDGTPTLTDFGIAKSVASHTQLTKLGYAVGTPEYMSPEQARAGELDGRSDLYSLGIVFYELLTGKRPFQGRDSITTAMMHINRPVPVLPRRVAEYQPIIARLLAKNPEDRFANARDLVKALDSILAQAEVVEDPHVFASTAPTMIRPHVVQQQAGEAAVVASGKLLAGAGRRARWKWITLPGLALVTVVVVGFSMPSLLTRFLPDGGDLDTGDKTVESLVPPNKPAAPASEFQERVERLLAVAKAHQAIGRLREPPWANAYEAYKMVLEMDPDNEQAKQGIREIQEIEALGTDGG